MSKDYYPMQIELLGALSVFRDAGQPCSSAVLVEWMDSPEWYLNRVTTALKRFERYGWVKRYSGSRPKVVRVTNRGLNRLHWLKIQD